MLILSKFHICYARHLIYVKKKSCLFAFLNVPCCVGSDLKILVDHAPNNSITRALRQMSGKDSESRGPGLNLGPTAS